MVVVQGLGGIADQQRPSWRAAGIACRAVQQTGAEQQDIAGVPGHDRCLRTAQFRRQFEPFAAMRSGHDPRGTVFRSEGVEEGQRGNRLWEAWIGTVAMQELRAAAGAGLAALDLRQKKRQLQDLVRGGKQRRQAANLLHCGIEIEQCVAPIIATRDRPFV